VGSRKGDGLDALRGLYRDAKRLMREADRNEAAARSIWPGPAASGVSEGQQGPRPYTLRLGPHGVLRNGWGGIPGAYGPPTVAEGIALGWVAARKRERFSMWLAAEANGARAAWRSKHFAGDPVAFVMKCDWFDLCAVCRRAGFSWHGLPLRTQKALRLALLASPEWAALSKQWEGR
jgi:hypothetical protein